VIHKSNLSQRLDLFEGPDQTLTIAEVDGKSENFDTATNTLRSVLDLDFFLLQSFIIPTTQDESVEMLLSQGFGYRKSNARAIMSRLVPTQTIKASRVDSPAAEKYECCSCHDDAMKSRDSTDAMDSRDSADAMIVDILLCSSSQHST
jgi:hypothetical protein